MKTQLYNFISVKSFVIAIAMFIGLTLSTKSAFAQWDPLQQINVVNGWENINYNEPHFDVYTDGTSKWVEWKIVGTWYSSDGLYALDVWKPMGDHIEIENQDVTRRGSTNGYISNKITAGYGQLYRGTHLVYVNVEETTYYPMTGTYHTTGYAKNHTYVVI